MLEQTINTVWFQFLDQVNNVISSDVVEWNIKPDLMGEPLYFVRKSRGRNCNNALFVIQILGRCQKHNCGATGFLLYFCATKSKILHLWLVHQTYEQARYFCQNSYLFKWVEQKLAYFSYKIFVAFCFYISPYVKLNVLLVCRSYMFDILPYCVLCISAWHITKCNTIYMSKIFY